MSAPQDDPSTESSNVIDADDVVEVETVDRGPWALLLASMSGVVGVLLYWSFGEQTGLGYVLAFSTFAALMYAILWNARRTKANDSSETI